MRTFFCRTCAHATRAHRRVPRSRRRRYEREFPAARYAKRGGGFEIDREPDGARVPWIPVDPGDERATESFPLFAHATPLVVDVRAGETLYLPALWYHKVEQIGWAQRCAPPR